jgi:hypothetical protein
MDADTVLNQRLPVSSANKTLASSIAKMPLLTDILAVASAIIACSHRKSSSNAMPLLFLANDAKSSGKNQTSTVRDTNIIKELESHKNLLKNDDITPS